MTESNLANAQKILGEKLRQIREAGNKTMDQIAAAADIPPTRLLKIEEGTVNLRILTLLKLCKGYDVSIEKLLEDFDFLLPD